MPTEKHTTESPIPGIQGVLVRHMHQNQLANRWHMSPRTLEQWRWLCLGPRYLRIGRRIVYRLEDVEAFESQQARG
jgi:hypothetical protein